MTLSSKGKTGLGGSPFGPISLVWLGTRTVNMYIVIAKKTVIPSPPRPWMVGLGSQLDHLVQPSGDQA